MFHITTASHPSSDLSRPSLVLINPGDGKRYLFGNIPEGCQRMINEKKLGLSKIDEIFFTGTVDWDSIGGLPGFILTSADQGHATLKLNYSGTDKFFKYIVSTWRYFVFRFGLDLKLNEVASGEEIRPSNAFSVTPISLGATVGIQDGDIDSKMTAKYELLSGIVDRVFPRVEVPKNKNSLNMIGLPTDIPLRSTKSCSYVINFATIRGKFLPEKAKALNVPKGPLYARLTKGENVTLPDGTVITSQQVMDPPREFGSVLVLDIPSKEFLDSTLTYEWDFGATDVVYHFLGDSINPEVLNSSQYQSFIAKFGDAKHLISHKDLCSDAINFRSAALLTLRLKSINNELFRLPQLNVRDLNVLQRENVSILNSSQTITVRAESAATVVEAPDVADSEYWSKLYDQVVAPLDLDFYTKKEIISSEYNSSAASPSEVEVIALGTGSALPSKSRNVISTVLRVPTENGKVQGVVLDAGENTIGAIKRLYRAAEYKRFFAEELSLIFLSHLHADHHLGIISLIREFNRLNVGANERKLVLVSPWQYDLFLKEWFKFNDNVDELKNIVYLNTETFENSDQILRPWKQVEFEEGIGSIDEIPKTIQPTFGNSTHDVAGVLKELCGVTHITTCKAIHCTWAYSVVIEFETGFKVAYSGDTRPSPEFAHIGQGADLLIHESTLEDELIVDAIEKKHTTILEAKHVAALMHVKKLMLTHFSQRYPKLPNVKHDAAKEKTIRDNCISIDPFSIFRRPLAAAKADAIADRDIIYAFDNMWFRYDEIHLQYERFANLNALQIEKALVEDAEDGDEEVVDVAADKTKANNGKKRSRE